MDGFGGGRTLDDSAIVAETTHRHNLIDIDESDVVL